MALNMSSQLVDLKAQIAQKTSQTLSQQQKEHFLRQQINAMQEELGGASIEDEEMDDGYHAADDGNHARLDAKLFR